MVLTLARALLKWELLTLIEDIFDLVEQQQDLPLRKEGLRGTERTQPPLAADRIAQVVFAGDLEQFGAQFLGEHLGLLCLAGTRRAIEQDVDSAPTGRRSLSQIRAKYFQDRRQVLVVGQTKVGALPLDFALYFELTDSLRSNESIAQMTRDK